jgi:purine-binding chemotaxis protein CheW
LKEGVAVNSTVRSAAEGAASQQVLTFRLGEETYGIDILRVKEIRGWSPVTRLPQSPSHVLGVLNLRGAVVPIIDLRRQFALESAGFSPTTVTIVLSLQSQRGVQECGIVVDAVADVVDLPADAVRPAPELGHQPRSKYVLGLATVAERMLIILDARCLAASGEQPVEAVTQAA